MSSAFTLTARDIVKQAMIELKVIAAGEEPTASELNDGLFRLNSMLKSWGTKMPTWLQIDRTVTLDAGTISVTLPADVAEVGYVAIEPTVGGVLIDGNQVLVDG